MNDKIQFLGMIGAMALVSGVIVGVTRRSDEISDKSGPSIPIHMKENFPICLEKENWGFCEEAWKENGWNIYQIPVDSWNG